MNGRREMDVPAVWLGRGRETSPPPGPGPAVARAPTMAAGPWLPDDSRPRVLSLSKLSKCLSVQVSEVPWCRVSGCPGVGCRARVIVGVFSSGVAFLVPTLLKFFERDPPFRMCPGVSPLKSLKWDLQISPKRPRFQPLLPPLRKKMLGTSEKSENLHGV